MGELCYSYDLNTICQDPQLYFATLPQNVCKIIMKMAKCGYINNQEITIKYKYNREDYCNGWARTVRTVTRVVHCQCIDNCVHIGKFVITADGNLEAANPYPTKVIKYTFAKVFIKPDETIKTCYHGTTQIIDEKRSIHWTYSGELSSANNNDIFYMIQPFVQ